jgi:hypothetical protein
VERHNAIVKLIELHKASRELWELEYEINGEIIRIIKEYQVELGELWMIRKKAGWRT